MASSTVARRPVIGQRVVDVFELCQRAHAEAVEFRKPTECWMEDAEFYKAKLERLEPTLDSTPELKALPEDFARDRLLWNKYLMYAIRDAMVFLHSIREDTKGGSRQEWVEDRLTWIGRSALKMLGKDIDPSEESLTAQDMFLDLLTEKETRIEAYILKHSLNTVIKGLKAKGLHKEVNEQYREYAKYHLNILIRADMMVHVFRGVAEFAEYQAIERHRTDARISKANEKAEPTTGNAAAHVGGRHLTSASLPSKVPFDSGEGLDDALLPDLSLNLQRFGRSQFLAGVKQGRDEADDLRCKAEMQNFRLERRCCL